MLREEEIKNQVKIMAMLPILLDMVDEMYNSLENPQKTFSDIPLLFVPQRNNTSNCPSMRRCPRGQHVAIRKGCPFRSAQKCPRENEINNGGCPCKRTSENDFKVNLNVKSFRPEEIAVKIKDHEIIVEGKHEEREDEYGIVSRQFTRRYTLPAEFDPDTVATFLNADGVMTIKAVKPKPIIESNERVIPIERVPPTNPIYNENENGEASKANDDNVEETFEDISKETEINPKE